MFELETFIVPTSLHNYNVYICLTRRYSEVFGVTVSAKVFVGFLL